MTTTIAAPLLFGIAASVATGIGGTLALRLGRGITLLLGLAAGIVIGVALFDLIPEALALVPGLPPRVLLGWVAAGFAAYLLVDRALGRPQAAGGWRVHLGPASLTLHSLFDGMGIGLAYQAAPAVGLVVALAVLTHDVADGINTVSLALSSERPETARRWLVANGAAPLIGVIIGLFVRVPDRVLAPLLGIFAGIFLFIGAGELLPRSKARDPRLRVALATVSGIALMLLVSGLAR